MKKARLEDASQRIKKLIDLKDSINQLEFNDAGMSTHVSIICNEIHKELTELQRFVMAVDIELNHKPSASELQVTKEVYHKR